MSRCSPQSRQMDGSDGSCGSCSQNTGIYSIQLSQVTIQHRVTLRSAMLLPVIRTALAGLLEAISFITSPEHLTFSQRPNIAKTLVGGHYYSSFVTC